MRLEDDRGRPFRVPALDRLPQNCLGVGLDRVVEGERNGSALAFRGRANDVEHAAQRVLHDRLLAGMAGQEPVEPELDAREAPVVDACVSQHLRGDGVLRIETTLLRIEAEPRETELLQRRSLLQPVSLRSLSLRSISSI